MSDLDRTQGVTSFGGQLPLGPVREALELLRSILHRVTSIVEFPLILDTGGVTFTNAAVSPGSALATTRDGIDFVDAGLDQVRCVVYGNNSAAGTVEVTVYDVTDAVELCRVQLSGATPALYVGEWTSIDPTAGDHTVEVRVIGDGVFDPVVYRVSLQGRTLAAQA